MLTMSEVDVLKEPYQCAVCEKRFSEKSAREKHYFSHANLANGVKGCRQCGSFCIKGSEHCKKLKKQKRNLLRCKECRIYFISEFDLKEHNLVTHKPKNTCEYCDKSFTTKRGLIFHLRLHLKIKPYVCHVCDKAFTWKTILRDHILTHSNEKAFGCEFCNRRFTTKKGLKKHYLIHTKEKPYMCETCGRCFSALGNLKTHYRTHNKVKKESALK